MPFDLAIAMSSIVAMIFCVISFGLGFLLGSESELRRNKKGRMQEDSRLKNDKRLARRSRRGRWL